MKESNLVMGMNGNASISIDNKQLTNEHLIVTGRSGGGKTYGLKNLIIQRANQEMVIIPDTSDSFDSITAVKERKVKVIDVYYEGIGIKPLEPHYFDESHKEKWADVAMRFSSVMSSIYRLGITQQSFLYQALKECVGIEGSTNEKLLKVHKFLSEKGGDSVVNLRAKLEYLTDLHVFSDRDDFANDCFVGGGIVLLKLSHFPTPVKRLITELLLWEIWKKFQVSIEKENRVTIILDECQTLDFSSQAPTTKILTEGRKFGISCWLATQFLKGNFSEATINRLEQADMKLYFRPTENDLKHVAEILDYPSRKKWVEVLKQLKVGEFVLFAPYRINEKSTARIPIIIKAESGVVS